MKSALTFLAFLMTLSASGQSLQQLQSDENRIERIERLEAAMKTLNEVDAKIDKHTKSRNLACMKAVGSASFCGCLNESLPWIFSFDEYVAITTKTKQVNQYNKLTKDAQAAYDKVGVVRDKCVAALPTSTK